MDSIEQYIHAAKKSGFSAEQIRARLVAAGHDLADVEEHLNLVEKGRKETQLLTIMAILIILAGTLMFLNFENITNIYQRAITVYEDSEIDLLSLAEEGSLDQGRLAGANGIVVRIPILNEKILLTVDASGTYCKDPILHTLRVGAAILVYDPLEETLEEVNGNYIRRELTPEEKERAKESKGWPVLSIYIDDELVGRQPIISEGTARYDIRLSAGDRIGSDADLRLAFENRCSYREDNESPVIRRELYLDSAVVRQRDAIRSTIFG